MTTMQPQASLQRALEEFAAALGASLAGIA